MQIAHFRNSNVMMHETFSYSKQKYMYTNNIQPYLHCDCNLQFWFLWHIKHHIPDSIRLFLSLYAEMYCLLFRFKIPIFEVAFLIWNFIKFMTRLTFSPHTWLGCKRHFEHSNSRISNFTAKWTTDWTEANDCTHYVCWFGSVKLISTQNAKYSEMKCVCEWEWESKRMESNECS